MIAQVARLISENKIDLPFGLYITNSVQEEVGLRGMNEEEINPDSIYDDLIEVSEIIKPFISRTQEFLTQARKDRKRILYEVALGCFINFLSSDRSNSKKSSAGEGKPAETDWE